MMKKKCMVLALVFFMLTLTACGHEFDSYRPIEDVNNLEGRKVGVNLAWPADYVLSPRDGKDLILYRLDELVYPLLQGGALQATLRLICSETSAEHVVLISVEGAEGQTLAQLDPLSRKLLEAACVWIDEKQKENETEVMIRL